MEVSMSETNGQVNTEADQANQEPVEHTFTILIEATCKIVDGKEEISCKIEPLGDVPFKGLLTSRVLEVATQVALQGRAP